LDHAGRSGDDGRDRECRLRVAAIGTAERAADLCHEVEALYTNGPAGGGGVRTDISEVIGIVSTWIPRDAVHPRVTILEAHGAREIA
ncbi:MAG: acyclic terpene utilization AtuA family protein, partial [Nocardioidaceae bacterium]